MTNKSATFGFTLIESLLALAMLGVLLAIALPSYQNQTCKSDRKRTQADLMAFARALDKYATTHNFLYRAANGQTPSVFPLFSPSDQAETRKKFSLSVTLGSDGRTYDLVAQSAVTGYCSERVYKLNHQGERSQVYKNQSLNTWDD